MPIQEQNNIAANTAFESEDRINRLEDMIVALNQTISQLTARLENVERDHGLRPAEPEQRFAQDVPNFDDEETTIATLVEANDQLNELVRDMAARLQQVESGSR